MMKRSILLALLFAVCVSSLSYADIAMKEMSCPENREVVFFEPVLQSDINLENAHKYLLQWVALQVPQFLTTNTGNDKQHLDEIKKFFTSQGWQDFESFWKAEDFESNLYPNGENKMVIVSSFSRTAPSLVERKAFIDEETGQKGYKWVFLTDISSTFRHEKNREEKNSRVGIVMTSIDDLKTFKVHMWKAGKEPKK